MHIDEEKDEDRGVTLLRLRGEFWGGEEWAVNDKVKDLIEREQTRVVIDLSKIARINSQGIGVLVSCLTLLRDVEGEMKIAGANPNISSHLELLKLYTVLESFPTAEEAVESFV